MSSPSMHSILAIVAIVKLCSPLSHLDISAFFLPIALANSVLFQPFRANISFMCAAIAKECELLLLLSSGIFEYNQSNVLLPCQSMCNVMLQMSLPKSFPSSSSLESSLSIFCSI